MIGFPEIDLAVLAPIGFTAGGAMVILVAEVVLLRTGSLLGRPLTAAYRGTLLAFTAMFILALALYVAVVAFSSGEPRVFQVDHPMFQQDPFAAFATALVAIAALLTCALSVAYLSEIGIHQGEYYALILLSTAGAMLLVGAIDLLSVFVGLELMSIPIYVLAGFDRSSLRSNEAALKYFVMGSFASAILLYGMALLYGTAGSTSFAAIRGAFDLSSPVAVIGLALVLVGFGFKVAATPFHQWVPDVYEGAPTSVTAFMSATVKVAAFAALLRFVATAIGSEMLQLSGIFWALAVSSMVVGNVMALIQRNVKRMLAYSSIGHAGYLLVGLSVGSERGYTALVFYLVVYVFMNVGALGVVIALARDGRDCEEIGDFAGLARAHPGLAALMTLFMLSLAGIPGTAGFMGKFQLVAASVQVGMVWLPVAIVLTSVVSVFYYLRVPVMMYMRDPGEELPRSGVASGEALALLVCALAVVYLGFFPTRGPMPGLSFDISVLQWAAESVKQFFGA